MITQVLNEKITRAVLVLVFDGKDEQAAEESLDELSSLIKTAGGTEVARVTQARTSPDTRTYIGSGKVKELAEFINGGEGDIDLVVFDNELTPSQIKNLEAALDTRVIDRTMLILDIFAQHATTGEGKLQVEIACLRYIAPRLLGKGLILSRLGGGIGTRGPGETKLETDRRHLKTRIRTLTEQLRYMDRTRSTMRAAREKSGILTAAIVGYTNSGKSTLLNYLTDAGILAEDKLFATLDPTTRRLQLPNGYEVLLTDTVGFIDRLPTHLIKAFKSTLDELKYADVIINIIDVSEEDDIRRKKRKVTDDLINELGAEGKPIINIYNKIDKAIDLEFLPKDAITISAVDGTGVDKLILELEKQVAVHKKIVQLFFAHSKQKELAELYKSARIINTEYINEGTNITAECDEKTIGKFSDFIID